MLLVDNCVAKIYKRCHLKGYVIKLIGGLYTIVDIETKEKMDATARGKLRYVRLTADNDFLKQTGKKTKKDIKMQAISPKVGDYVLYEIVDGKAMIEEVLPRKNELSRPDVTNIDQVLLVFSCVRPDFSFQLLDKFLVILEQNNLTPVIIVSKIDLIDPQALDILKTQMTYYQTYYDVYYVNSKQRIGFDVLQSIFKDKLTVLAGQTGVGKSTLMNALLPELNLKTQEISDALGRGKHTTRHAEAYIFNEGYIADTPGFSKIELEGYDFTEIKENFIDFNAYSHLCKFKNQCHHLTEPGCHIKEMVSQNLILPTRYESYVSFVNEIKNKKVKY